MDNHFELLGTTHSGKKKKKVLRMVPVGLLIKCLPGVGDESGDPVGMPPGPSFLTYILRGVLELVCFPRLSALPQDNCLSSFWHQDK